MRHTTTVLGFAIALAMPLAASANNYDSNHPVSSSVHQGANTMRNGAQRTGAAVNNSLDRSDRAISTRRGGGPMRSDDVNRSSQTTPQSANPVVPADARARQLHEISPHIVFVQSKLDAAVAEARGIGRLASLERQPMSDTYRQHLRGITQDVESDVTSARHHLDELRSGVQGLQVSDAVRNDIQQADTALNQVRTDIQQFTQQQNQADARAFSNTITRDLNNAKSAMDRVERGLR